MHPINGSTAARTIDALDYGRHSAALVFGIVVEPEGDDGSKLIGWCGLDSIDWPSQRASVHATIVGPQYRGLGYGTESLLLLLQLAFDELALNKVTGVAVEYNTRALRAFKRVGFVTEACRREAHFHGGRYHDVVVMSLLCEEYRRLHGYEGLRRIGYTDRQIEQLGTAIRDAGGDT